MMIVCFVIFVIGEMDAQELSFTSSLSHAHNPNLEEVLAMQREVERGGGGEGEEGGRGEVTQVTLLHLMDDDDDD